MAVSNLTTSDVYDSVLTTTMRAYRKTLVNQVEAKIPLLAWLERKGKRKQRGGVKISIPVIYQENQTVAPYKGYDTFDVTPQEGMTRVEYDWSHWYASISISGDDETDNMGEAQLIDLLKARTKQAEDSLRARINDALHGVFGYTAQTTGAGATAGSGVDALGNTAVLDDGRQLNSLDHLVRMLWGMVDVDTTGARTHTVGGIQVSVTTNGTPSGITDLDAALAVTAETNTWWMNYCVPGFRAFNRRNTTLGGKVSNTELDYVANITSGQNITHAMRSLHNRLKTMEDGEPDVGLTSTEVLGIYEAAMVPLERFTSMETGDMGFRNVVFRNMTLIADPGITGALPSDIVPTALSTAPVPLYMLNSDYLEWVVHPSRDFYMTPFYRPHNQDARTSQILLKANLACTKRAAQGVLACGAEDNGYDA